MHQSGRRKACLLPLRRTSARHSEVLGVRIQGDATKVLIFQNLRRTVARNLRRVGIAEAVIMKIGERRTRSVFERYAIVSRTDIAEGMRRLQNSEAEMQMSTHDLKLIRVGSEFVKHQTRCRTRLQIANA